ncbi:MAG: LysR family transcriptional regulator [Proteobacteria bacterium]|nr:LysR family transcriptional regulator [Pseudomonadota bacterium]
MDRLITMRVFQTVADQGGFAAAARALDMSPATVTRFVADLERDVGARLLQRSTRRVSLTEAGAAYLTRVRAILANVDEARAVAQEYTMGMSGVLRVCAGPVVATHVLAPLVAEFRARNPAVRLDIHVRIGGDSPIADHDITLFSAPAGYDADVIARPFASSVGVLCAATAYLQRRPAPRTPQELPEHDCLLANHMHAHGGVVRLSHPEHADRMTEVALRPVCVVNHADTLMAATLGGAGIAVLSVDLVAEHLRSGALVRVLAPWTCGRYTLYAALPSRKFMPARTRAFLEFLTERTRVRIREALSE